MKKRRILGLCIENQRIPDSTRLVYGGPDSNYLSALRSIQQFRKGENGRTSTILLSQGTENPGILQFAKNWQCGLLGNSGALDEIARLKNRPVEKGVEDLDRVLRPGKGLNPIFHRIV